MSPLSRGNGRFALFALGHSQETPVHGCTVQCLAIL